MAKKLIVLFDANPLATNHKSGVGFYTARLIEALATTYPDEILLVGHYFNFLRRRKIGGLPTGPNISYVTSTYWPGKVLNLARKMGFQLPLELLFKRRGDIALFTNFVSLPSLTKVPTAITIHDMCFEDMPEYVSATNQRFLHRFVPKSVRSAKLVLVVSRTTKAAVKKHYNTEEHKFVLTPIAPPDVSLGPKTKSNHLAALGIKGKYVLFIGTLEPRKNIVGLLAAYASLPTALKKQYQLVIAGGPGWHDEEIREKLADAQAASDRVVTPGYIADETKALLYLHTSLFVLPSYYEGFGMPILEAMSYRVPIAASNLPVFREVGGEAISYFDQNNPIAIADTIATLLEDTKTTKKLVASGQKVLARYSWESVAQTVYKRLRDVADNN